MHYGEKRNDYYDEKHYIRIPPHILCTPVVAELPRPYGDKNEKDDVLLVAVSYYFDEDEYEGHRSYKRFTATDVGDETEVKRGQYVASAILGYNLGDFGRWDRHCRTRNQPKRSAGSVRRRPRPDSSERAPRCRR